MARSPGTRTTPATMTTNRNDVSLESALAGVPNAFRDRLIKAYRDLKAAFASGQHDAAGLRAGRFCEVGLRLLQKELTGNYTPFGTAIRNFGDECKKLEETRKDAGPESLRLVIPRALTFLYTLRNKRGISHEGGDVDANEIDAATCVRLADWCLCELIRVYHSLSLEEAQAILDAISEREVPEVWSVVGRKRVLDPSLDYPTQTLLLLYSEPETALPVEDLFEWIEHPRLADYKRFVLRRLHQRRHIEWDQETETVIISPTGSQLIDERLRG